MANDAQMMLSLFFAVYFTLMIDRSHEAYNPYDTYGAWTGRSFAHRRLVLSWLFLFLFPLIHFAVTYQVLGEYPLRFDWGFPGAVNIVLAGFLSFFSFGYYRIFESFLNGFPDFFFSELEKEGMESRPEFHAHFIPGFLYIILTVLIQVLIIFFLNN